MAKVSPSVVLVVAQDKAGNNITQGSGFFYKPGLVATSLHVLKIASQGYIKLLRPSRDVPRDSAEADGFPGIVFRIEQVVGIDMEHDLCAIAVQASVPPLPMAKGAVSTMLPAHTGDEVYVAGNPLGMESSFSKGIVSAVRPEFGLIQIDAAVSPGSSGGPVVNTRGQVIGVIASSLVAGQNLNFAVPANLLESLAELRMPVEAAGMLAVTDRDRYELKGPVKSVTLRVAGPGGGPARPGSTREFDNRGRVVGLHRYYITTGMLAESVSYEYDSHGFLISERTASPGANPVEKKFSRLESANERVGSVTAERSEDYSFEASDGRQGDTLRKFDRNGWIIEEQQRWDGKLYGIDRYTYVVDELGNWIERSGSSYRAQFPDLGFTASGTTYREITYYKN